MKHLKGLPEAVHHLRLILPANVEMMIAKNFRYSFGAARFQLSSTVSMILFIGVRNAIRMLHVEKLVESITLVNETGILNHIDHSKNMWKITHPFED